MNTAEIVVPATKPETEWLCGRPVRKVSPTRGPGRLQGRLLAELDRWAQTTGQVAPEWRFRLAPPGEPRRPLVPDIAYVSSERLRGLTFEEAEAPTFAPDVAVEILSADDRPLDLADKIRVYLASGTTLIIVVDPQRRTVVLIDRARRAELTTPASLQHRALPGFELPLGRLFSALDLPQ